MLFGCNPLTLFYRIEYPLRVLLRVKESGNHYGFQTLFLSYLSRFSFPAFHCEVCTHDDEGYAEQLSHVE